MKSVTPYLGVRVPIVRKLARRETRLRPFADQVAVVDTVRALWHGAEYREERYASMALLDTPSARALRTPELLSTLQDMIVTGAWWDYVDELAHRVGELLSGWPTQVRPNLVIWAKHEDRWLRRASIICQLGSGDLVDTDLLTFTIEASADESDFFLRKAIGWALRDYARTDPDWVRSFVNGRQLSPLSRREALKHIR
jgi:3-methyladenine DNA glycosylase AlkD